MNRKTKRKSASKVVSTTNRHTLTTPMNRTGDGRFAKGNAGGPGRPKASEEAHGYFLNLVKGIIKHPERFSDLQRIAMVRLVTSFMDGRPDREAIAAAAVLVKMEQVNIDMGLE